MEIFFLLVDKFFVEGIIFVHGSGKSMGSVAKRMFSSVVCFQHMLGVITINNLKSDILPLGVSCCHLKKKMASVLE